MNTWEDAAVIKRVNEIGKDRIVLAGLWTSVCIVGPALSAISQGYKVYVIADACGDVSTEAHDRAMDRMIQAGARPMTSLQYLLELQRDWARSETYELTTGIAKKFGGACGNDQAQFGDVACLPDALRKDPAALSACKVLNIEMANAVPADLLAKSAASEASPADRHAACRRAVSLF